MARGSIGAPEIDNCDDASNQETRPILQYSEVCFTNAAAYSVYLEFT